MMPKNEEFKNIIGDIVNKLVNFFKLDSFKINIDNFLTKQYTKGIDSAEIRFNMNFKPAEDISFLKDYAMQNVNDAADQIGKDLRKEISRSILNKENKGELVKKIKTMFNDKKYSDRMKTILRTEGLSANNQGKLDGARQSGLNPKKYLDIVLDNRTSDICKAEGKKYGTPEQAIPLEEDFIVTVKIGKKVKTVSGKRPVFHPNCRTTLRFVRTDE